jgi:hypothetical protein
MDEGWPIHAAMEMHDGKTLYDEVFWVFPPGHVLPAWIGYGLAPPGLVPARIIYGIFSVALCVALYFVSRRFMPANFALLAGLLIATAAPLSHTQHLLFGYRYLVWSVIVLLFFHLRLARNDSRWLFPAGIFAGIALFFRLTPAFAVSVAIGVGILAASRDWRTWLREGLYFSAGLILFWIPILLWFHSTVGLEQFWREMVLRPLVMTDLQSLPFPSLNLPNMSRFQISYFVASIGFRFYPLLFISLALTLTFQWGKALHRRTPFKNVFLLTFVVFGGTFFVRSMGRSDVPHLDSAIPPVLVLLAYCVSFTTRLPVFRPEVGGRMAVARKWTLLVCFFGAWSYLNGVDLYLHPEEIGDIPLKSAAGTIYVSSQKFGTSLDKVVPPIQKYSEPGDTILVMTNAPIIYPLAQRYSPGYFDVIMPGTFRSTEEELRFLEHLKAEPPTVVVWPRGRFDRMGGRGLKQTAPELAEWIVDHYLVAVNVKYYAVMVPRKGSSHEPRPVE